MVTLMSFPQEILEQVFQYCSNKTLLDFACSSQCCHSSVNRLLHEKVKIKWYTIEKDQILLPLHNLKNTKHIKFTSGSVSDRVPHWSDIFLNFRKIIEICDSSKLTSFNIEHQSFKDEELSIVIDKMPNLQKITLACCFKISCMSLVYFSKLKCLKSLSIIYCDIGIHNFNQLDLEELTLYQCPWANQDNLKLIASMSNLKRLTFSHMGEFRLLSDDVLIYDIKKLHCLHNLQELDISNTKIEDEEGLIILLQSLLFLKRLDVSGISLTISFSYICMLPLVSELIVSNCDISDEQIRLLGSIQSLTALDISFSDITDSWLKNLSILVLLEHLEIRDCTRITDEGVLHLKSLSLLKSIKIDGCSQLSNGCLIYLSMFPSLEKIFVDTFTSISEVALAQMKLLKKNWNYHFG